MKVVVLGRANYSLLRDRLSRLVDLGHEIHLISLQAGEIPGVTAWRLKPLVGPLGYALHLPQIRSVISRLKPDVVDVQGVTSYGVYGLARCWSTPFLLTVYGSDVSKQARDSRPLAWIARRALRNSDLVHGSSGAAVAEIQQVLNLDVSPKFRAHTWGVPVADIRAGHEESRESVRREFSIPANARIVFHNRTMVDHWRVLQIIESIPFVVSRMPDVHFWFAYAPPNRESRRYLAQVQRRIAELRVGGRTRLFGPQSHQRMICLLHAADLYLCLGKSDLLSTSLLEALCAGKVPIVSDLPAYDELLGKASEFYLPEVSPESLTARILLFLGDLPDYAGRVAKIAARVHADYDAMPAARSLVEIYRETIAAHRFR